MPSKMSFRKRNIGISDGRRPQLAENASPVVQLPGVRPSTADGRPVTSTGSSSFDGLFAGHGGIPLGTAALIQENGTTDYAGALLRFFAAEGLLQGHHVHVVAMPEAWGRELPGLATESTKSTSQVSQDEKMKIAWRYEKLGQHEPDSLARGGFRAYCNIFLHAIFLLANYSQIEGSLHVILNSLEFQLPNCPFVTSSICPSAWSIRHLLN